jgi:hypothetical protein
MAGMVNGPYFSVEGRDVVMFANIRGAESFIESYDVKPGQDTLFAADGSLVRLAVDGRRVRVTRDVVGKDPGGLAEVLRTFLLEGRRKRTLTDDEIRSAPLADLVAEFMRTERAL